MSSCLNYLLRPFVTLVIREIQQTSIFTQSSSRNGRYLSALCRHIGSFISLIWHEFIIKPCQEGIRACISSWTIMIGLISIGIKVCNAVQGYAIMALTVVQIRGEYSWLNHYAVSLPLLCFLPNVSKCFNIYGNFKNKRNLSFIVYVENES